MNAEKEQLEQSQAANVLLLEMVRNQKSNTRNLIKVFIITVICYTLILATMIIGFYVYESQFETYEKVVTETTTTQEVSGEDSEINNIEGDMYKDSATHYEEMRE